MMTVEELITELEKIEDKKLPACCITDSSKIKSMDVYFETKDVHYSDGYGTFEAAVMYGDY